MLYLTARAIGQADLTRQYLFELLEQERKNLNSKEVWFFLPEGPVIMAPDSLLGAFHREVIKKRPQVKNIFTNYCVVSRPPPIKTH